MCKPNTRRSSVTAQSGDFKLKEKYQIRKVEIRDREDIFEGMNRTRFARLLLLE